MDEASVYTLIKNLDDRTQRIEQYLPRLPTRDEMHAAIHAAIQAAVEPLATRREMQAAIQTAVAPLPTREEMHAAIQAEGEASRQFTRVLFEDLRDDNRIALEYLVVLSARVDELARR